MNPRTTPVLDGDTAEISAVGTSEFNMVNQTPRLITPPENILLVGPQGSGKNVYGRMLMKDFEHDRLVMGDRLRDIASEDSALGREVALAQAKGEKADHATVMRVLDEYLMTRNKIAETLQNGSVGIARRSLFDGIPRFPEQVADFDQRLEVAGRDPAVAVELVFSEQSSRSNIRHRMVREGRGDDADEEAVTKRLGGYFAKGGTRDMLEKYHKNGRLVSVNAELGLDLNDPMVTEEEVQAAFSRIYASILDGLKARG